MADGEDPTMMEENHPFVEKESKHRTRQWWITVGALVVLGVLLVISLLAIIGLTVALVVVSLAATSNNSTSNSTNCTTADCIELAATVLQNMDPSIDPCVDFYNYTCGGWNANHELPGNSGTVGVFQELDVNNKIKLKKLLEGDVDREVTAVTYLRNFYGHCLNLTNLTILGAEPLYELLNQTGGWDLVGVHNATAPNWSISSADFRMSKLHGNPGFFSFAVGVDAKNSSRSITEISQSGLSLPSAEAYQTPYYTSALLNYITSVLMLLNPDGDYADIQQAAGDIVVFEMKLAKIFVSSVALRDPVATYNLYQLDELHNSNLWSQFNWTDFTVEMFKAANVSVDPNLTVLVITPSFFKNLTDLYETTSPSVLENYFKWQLTGSYVPYLGANFLSVFYRFSQLVLGVGEQERYITCISVIENVAPMPLARLFTDYILPPGTRDDISRLITSIKDAFVERLETNDWLDDTTRQRSIWKVGNITQLIAYPDQIDDDAYLLESSEALNSTQGQGYFKTVIESQFSGALGNLEMITKPVDKSEWEIAPTQVNAYYEPLYNQFVFLEGIMRAPFLVAAWPDYFKLGAMGVVIGHELTHGFDDQGQQYNQNGILTPWWTQESVAGFKRRQSCFVNQYSQYSMFGYHINGNLTLGENIADNGGLKTAYQAYKSIAQNETQQTLPAIDLTPDQLFFVAFGQLWCSIFSPAFIATNLQVNPHSPGPYRVVGAVSNSEEFAAAFNCKAGDPMDPVNKCDLW